jgi:outer membrane protein TolC
MKKILIPFFLSLFLFANEKDDSILLPLKNEIKDLQIKSIKEKNELNKYEWLENLNINISQSKNNKNLTTKDYSLSLSQKVLDFGGIISQIDYSNYLFKQEALKIQMQDLEDLNFLYENLIDSKINDINVKQNILNINNSEIEVNIKKSLYKNGQSNISDLNDAIMKKNSFEDSKMQLQLERVKYENEIKKLSSYKISNINLPKIPMISKELFLENATKNLYSKLESKISQSNYKKTKSDYLPALKINATIGIEDSNEIKNEDYYSYGVSIFMPLSYTFSNDIEYSKLIYLQNKKEEKLIKIELEQIYESAFETIKQFENRINLATKDINLFEELLISNEEEFQAGFKAIEDVQTLKNSKEIRNLDIQKYKLNIQKEILKLYFQII